MPIEVPTSIYPKFFSISLSSLIAAVKLYINVCTIAPPAPWKNLIINDNVTNNDLFSINDINPNHIVHDDSVNIANINKFFLPHISLNNGVNIVKRKLLIANDENIIPTNDEDIPLSSAKNGYNGANKEYPIWENIAKRIIINIFFEMKNAIFCNFF